MTTKRVIVLAVLALAGWVGAVTVLLGGQPVEGGQEDATATPAVALRAEPISITPSETREEQFALDVAERLVNGGLDAAADVLAGLPASLEPAALLRIEAHVVDLVAQLQRTPALTARALPPDGFGAGFPVELVLVDGSAVVLRVVCDDACWLAGVEP